MFKDPGATPLISAALLATLLIGGMSALCEMYGIRGGDAIFQIILFFLLMKIFPESRGMALRPDISYRAVAIGILLGTLWILAVGWPNLNNTKFPTGRTFTAGDIALGILTTGIAAPLFEEKVVRGLLLDGLSRLTGPLPSSIITSVLFGIVHANSMLWAFCSSLVLCFCALRLNMTSVQRAITHGTCNMLILMWYLTGGLGLSG